MITRREIVAKINRIRDDLAFIVRWLDDIEQDEQPDIYMSIGDILYGICNITMAIKRNLKGIEIK